MGALGPALMFICLMLLECLLGAAVLTYAARCFCIIVEGTAAGNDEVPWPDEPMFDWIGRAAHLLWLVTFWLLPVALLLRLLRHLDPDAPAALLWLPPVVLFWLLFPISVLSSFSATSRWVIFRPAILGGLLRTFPATATFYFLTGVLVGGLAALGYLTFARGWALLLPVLAAAAAAGGFLYARLLGRLGGVLGQLAPAEPAEPAAPARPAERPPAGRQRPKKKRPARGVKTVDPWAVPKKQKAAPPASSPPVEGYEVADQDSSPRPAEAPAEGKRRKEPREEGYALSGEKLPPPPTATPLDGYLPVGTAAAADREPPRRGERAEYRREGPKPPAHPFLEGVWTFPWYGTSVGPWLAVAVGLLALGGVLQAMLSFWSQLQ
jgi:hypothetical protein